MDDESVVRRMAREAVRSGKLPRMLPHRTWGGRGTGNECAICSAPVTDDEVELELEFTFSNGCETTVSHFVHLQCFAAWELEQQTFTASKPSTGEAHLPTGDNGVTISPRELHSTVGRDPA